MVRVSCFPSARACVPRVRVRACVQWADELKKFAPNLECHMYYASKEKKAKALQRLRQADVLLTTPHMLGNSQAITETMLRHLHVHRLVLDEAHLLAEGTTQSKLSSLLSVRAKHVWLVSGTPMSTSLSNLRNQVQMLHLAGEFRTEEQCADNAQVSTPRRHTLRGSNKPLDEPPAASR